MTKPVPKRSVPRSLTAWRAKEMRRLHSEGEKIAYLAALFGVSDPTAWKVCARRTWRHVG